jgi:hypothetical protein
MPRLGERMKAKAQELFIVFSNVMPDKIMMLQNPKAFQNLPNKYMDVNATA